MAKARDNITHYYDQTPEQSLTRVKHWIMKQLKVKPYTVKDLHNELMKVVSKDFLTKRGYASDARRWCEAWTLHHPKHEWPYKNIYFQSEAGLMIAIEEFMGDKIKLVNPNDETRSVWPRRLAEGFHSSVEKFSSSEKQKYIDHMNQKTTAREMPSLPSGAALYKTDAAFKEGSGAWWGASYFGTGARDESEAVGSGKVEGMPERTNNNKHLTTRETVEISELEAIKQALLRIDRNDIADSYIFTSSMSVLENLWHSGINLMKRTGMVAEWIGWDEREEHIHPGTELYHDVRRLVWQIRKSGKKVRIMWMPRVSKDGADFVAGTSLASGKAQTKGEW